MKTFPMFLKTSGRRIVVIGGGEQAAQKARLALKTDAEILLIASDLDPELEDLTATGRARHHRGRIEPGLFGNAAIVFIATGCPGSNAALADIVRGTGAVVNVVDAPDLCDAFTPSIVDRDPVVVAIGTEGTAPVLARQIKTRLEEILEPRLGELATLAGRLRRRVAARVTADRRRAFWRWVFTGAPRTAHARGAERESARLIKDAIAAGGAPRDRAHGLVSLVGAGPGCRDLITLRGVQRLQEADIVFYDRLVDPELLELARRDAERVFVGKAPGAHAWPQGRINGVIVAAAREGKRVVRLKCGDPGIFARAKEEIEALDTAGVGWEIVPGVTAASAAAAAIGTTLTERGKYGTLVLSTGHGRDEGQHPDWSRYCHPGTTLAIYMGVASIHQIRDRLLAAGNPPSLPVEIVSRACAPDQASVSTTLGHLASKVSGMRVENPAVILVRHPETAPGISSLPRRPDLHSDSGSADTGRLFYRQSAQRCAYS